MCVRFSKFQKKRQIQRTIEMNISSSDSRTTYLHHKRWQSCNVTSKHAHERDCFELRCSLCRIEQARIERCDARNRLEQRDVMPPMERSVDVGWAHAARHKATPIGALDTAPAKAAKLATKQAFAHLDARLEHERRKAQCVLLSEQRERRIDQRTARHQAVGVIRTAARLWHVGWLLEQPRVLIELVEFVRTSAWKTRAAAQQCVTVAVDIAHRTNHANSVWHLIASHSNFIKLGHCQTCIICG